MRFVSRIFRGILLAAALVFAGVSPSFAIDPREECLANGFYWVENQCCWLYYRDEKDELVCINGDNWDSFEELKDCDPAAGYIDSKGTPHCCPEGTEPNSETHRCECKGGGFLDPKTGQCLLLYAKISNFCDLWNNRFKVGFFLNYLLGGGLGGLESYKSKHTCEEVIDAVPNNEGSNLLVWNESACRCSCKNSALTFNPGAADACADGDTAQCDNICVDLMDDNNPCPMGQQSYYIDGKWQCCIFYDPEKGKCITTDAEWRQYVTGTLRFESGGGYIGPDGLPIECPVGKQEDYTVVVNQSTAKCVCLGESYGGGTYPVFFDTTTGICKGQYQLDTEYGVIDPSTVSSYPGGLSTSNWGNVIKIQTVMPNDAITDVGPHMASNYGFLDTFLHTVFDTNGTYDYTDLPVSTANDNYIATDLYGYTGYVVTARRLAKITFSGNGGTPASQSKRMFVVDGTYSDMPVTPTRPGYDFYYWYDTAASSGGTQFDPFAMQGDATYYARWTPHTYKIRFNNTGCGGTTGGSMADQNMTYGTAANLNTNTFTCTGGNGYLFQGWATTNGGSVVYQPGAQVNNLTTTQNGTYNLYAVWVADNPSNVTVTLDLNGSASGSCSAGAHTISYGNSYTLPSWDSSSCNITNGVKVFVGWTETAPSSSNNYLDSGSVMVTPGGFPLYNLTTNKTYYAVWRTPTCGGSNVASATPVTANNNYPKCNFTCNAGYGTSGVKTGANAGDTSVTYNCENSCYQIPLDSTTNGGSGGPASIYLYYNTADGSDKNCKIYSDSSCSNQISHLSSYPTKTNASFVNYSKTTTGSSRPIIQDPDDDFAYLTWECNYYFDTNSFSPNMSYIANYACNEGYCAGCEVNGNYVTNMISGACNAAPTTTVSFNSTANGGTGGPTGTVTATYGVAMPDINSNPAVTLAAPTPPSLHRFSGFYNSASGSTGYYGSANPLQSGARWDKTNGTYTLYAKYERCGGALNYSTLTNSGYSTYNDKSGYISTEPGGQNYSSYNILTYGAAGLSVPSGSPAPTFDHWQCSLSGYGSCNGSLANVTSTNLCGSFNPGTTSSADFTRLLDDALCRGTVCMNACWKYNITYDLNDTTAVPATHATNTSAHPNDYTNCDGATIGGTAAADKPTRTGYDFAGWCTSDVGTTCYTNGSCCSMTQTINVDDTGHKNYYAKWSQNSVTCNPGYYLPANSTSSSDCAQCHAGSYCPGGAFSLDAATDNGEYTCPARQQDDLGNSTVAVTSDAGSSAVTQCYIHWLPDNCAEYINNVDYGGGINITTAQYSEHVRVYAQNDGTNNQDAYPTASRYIVPAKLYSLPGYEVDGDNSYNGNNNYVDVSNYPPNMSGYKGLYAIVGKSCTACTGNKYARGGGQLKWQAAGNVVMNGYGKCNSCVNGYTITGNEATDHDNSNDCKVTCGPGRAVQTANAACTAVGVTHWAPGGIVSQGSTSGNVGTCGQITGIDGVQKQLQTTGSGVGANEAGDCGLALHIGTDILRLRSSKKTTPSLNFNYSGNNGADLFLNLSTNASPMTSTQNFKMNYGGTLYYGCDDTTCVEDE